MAVTIERLVNDNTEHAGAGFVKQCKDDLVILPKGTAELPAQVVCPVTGLTININKSGRCDSIRCDNRSMNFWG